MCRLLKLLVGALCKTNRSENTITRIILILLLIIILLKIIIIIT